MDLVLLALLGATLLVAAYAAVKARSGSRILHRLEDRIERVGMRATQQLEAREHLHFLLDLPRGAIPVTRDWAASPDFLVALVRHALTARPEHMIECGSGVSTLVLAFVIRRTGQGHLVSLDHDADFLEQTRKSLALHGLEEHVTLIHAPLVEHTIDSVEWSWYDVSQVPSAAWDLIVVDGPPGHLGEQARYPVGPLIVSGMAPEGHAFLDDTHRDDDRAVSARIAEELGLRRTRHRTEKGLDVLTRVG